MSVTEDGNQYIFIGGAARSGTTLLQNILDSHPEINGGPEFLHIPDIIYLRNRFKTSLDKDYLEYYCNQSEVDAEIVRLIDRFLTPKITDNPVRYLSEKTPDNILVFQELAELFPRAKFIGIFRDPRATIASLLEVGNRALNKGKYPPKFAKNTKLAGGYVKKCMEAGLEAVKRHPDRVHTVKYEDLVMNPEQELVTLCGFLGIDFSNKMLTPAHFKHSGEAAITIKSKNIWYDKKSYNKNPHTDSLEKWKRVLSPSDKLIIYELFKDQKALQELGYNINTKDINGLTRAVVLALNVMKKVKRRLEKTLS